MALTLRSLRKFRNLSQAELASRIGVSHRYLQTLESGSVDIKISLIQELAGALKVPPYYFLLPKNHFSFFNDLLFSDIEIINFLPMGVSIADYNGRIHYMNHSQRMRLGIDHHDLLEREVFIWSFMESTMEMENLKKLIQMASELKPEPFPFYTRTKSNDGTSLPIRVDWQHLERLNLPEHIQRPAEGILCMITQHPSW